MRDEDLQKDKYKYKVLPRPNVRNIFEKHSRKSILSKGYMKHVMKCIHSFTLQVKLEKRTVDEPYHIYDGSAKPN